MTEEQAWLVLNAAELPSRTALALLERYGSPGEVLAAPVSDLTATVRLTPPELARLQRARTADPAAWQTKMARLGVRLVTIRDPEYPARLKEIYDAPPALFVQGTLDAEERAIGIVGTRRATPYGLLASETLARDLAMRGVTVVSGLAVGADAAAHRGALAAGGRTIGVLACGIDVPYPRDTLELRERMAHQGAVVSEVPLGTAAQRPRFPARNRLISGLSLGIVVTEAPERSGALITAEFAAEQGRQVFAVPGSFNSEFSRGTHALLRDGARLVESVADIEDELGLPVARVAPPPAKPPTARAPQKAPEAPQTPPLPALTSEEQALLEALSLQQRHVDAIIEMCRIPSSRASAGLLMLELKGLVRRLPGNMFMRVR